MIDHARQEALALKRSGVRHLFGVAGSGPSYDLLDACEHAGIAFVSTAHEGAAVMMAGAGAYVLGTPGAALSIKGPGAANLAAGLALARFEQQPVVSFAESYAPDAPTGQQHKRMPQDQLLGAVTKAVAYRRPDASNLEALIATATAEVPGPVHVNLAVGESRPSAAPSAPDAGDGELSGLLEVIGRAARPVVIVGAAVARLVRDQRLSLPGLSIPVFTTAAAKGAIDERTAAAAGVYTGAGGELAPERSILPVADCVVAIGVKNLEVLGAKPFPVPSVFVDGIAGHAEGFAATHVLTADDLAAAATAVLDALAAKSWGLDLVAEAHGRLAAALATAAFLPAAAYARLQVVAERLDARLVTDSGNFTVVAEHVWRAATPTGFLGSSIGRFMGVALPQALGAALADPSRPVICTTGDGGLPPYLAEARLAAERRLPLLLILMSDGYYGSMRAKVEARGLTRSGVTVPPTAWPRIFDALGWEAARVDGLERFEAVIAAWRGDAPLMVEATMPADVYVSSVLALR